MAATSPVVVVGGGWAGLSAALSLAQAGVAVTLFESAPQAGGRARGVDWQGGRVDNGQHLLLGAYSATLKLLGSLHGEQDYGLLRLPLRLFMRQPDGSHFTLKAPRLPAPLHLLLALLGAAPLPLKERLAALALGAALKRGLPANTNGEEWLLANGQSRRLIEQLWQPLSLAALNLPLSQVSAERLRTTLAAAFAPPSANSDLLIPRRDLSSLLVEPAVARIGRLGGTVQLRSRCQEILVDSIGVAGVVVRGERLPCRQLVLATAPRAAVRLLAPLLPQLAGQIEQLGSLPIDTIYLRYPTPTSLPPLQGLLDQPGQWLFAGNVRGRPDELAVVISGEGHHSTISADELAQAVIRQLASHYPHWPRPEEWRVMRERNATYAATPDNEQLRPANTTPLKGLWLAGDYTATNLPATLEGAVRSGLECARSIVCRLPQRGRPT